ncbi:LytTR family DNA-binding domain-containing protein [soil metagenome]
MDIKIVIIEDEPATARNLKHILQEIEPGITVLSILGTVKESVNWLKENAALCNLLFMDIRLADGLSFEIFENIQIDLPVIFVTAYNDYALKAFKANGIDYVLKPFDETELTAALNKFKKLSKSNNQHIDNTALLSIMQQIKTTTAYKKSFLVQYRDKLIPVNTSDIYWFSTENEIVHAAIAGGKQYMIDGTLEKLLPQLDPAQFFRANRQYIINRNAITEVNFFFNGRLALKLNPEPKENVLISKARVSEFKEWMNL